MPYATHVFCSSLFSTGASRRKQNGDYVAVDNGTTPIEGTAKSPGKDGVGLERKVGLFSGITLIIGTMIGKEPRGRGRLRRQGRMVWDWRGRSDCSPV